jgi:hypothetical protein
MNNVPEIGSIRIKEYPSGARIKQYFNACGDCGKGRWQFKTCNKKYCRSCALKREFANNPNHKKAILLGSKKRWDRDGERERMSNNMMGEKNHFYGKTHTKRVLAIISKSRTKIHVKPTSDWGYLIGIVLGDGWLKARKGSYIVGVSSSRPEIVKKFHEVCNSLNIHSGYYNIICNNKNVYCSEVCSKELYKYLRPCKSADFHFTVPKIIYKNKSMMYGFLRGFFDAEGGVYKNIGRNTTMNIACWSKHISSLVQIRDLLKIGGIQSYLHKENKKNQISARLNISDYENRLLFRNLVGFRIYRKQRKLDNMEKPFGERYTKEQYEWAMELRCNSYQYSEIQKITGVNKNTVAVWCHKKNNNMTNLIRAERQNSKIIENDKELSLLIP